MFINIHTHHASNQKNVVELVDIPFSTVSEKTATSFCSVGIHPWHADHHNIGQELINAIQSSRVIAIGECGLDKLKGPDLNIQTEIFTQQIKLSEQLERPLIVHCVKAYSEIIKLRKNLQPKQAWIFHGFNASKETMEQALKQGFYISVGEAILKKNSKANQTLPFIPHNRLFLETDNNPQLRIESIYEQASTLLNLELTQLQNIIQDNFKHLFNVDNRTYQPT